MRCTFPPGELLRAVIYCRISDDREGLELGVKRQEADGREVAAEMGARVVRVYTDNDIGASTRSRPKPRHDYDAMLKAVRSDEANLIIYYSNGRLTRRPLEYEEVIQLVEQTGVRLASRVSNNVDLTTADGRMMGRMQAAIDAAEVERTAERVERKLRENREQGKIHGGRHMTGWLKPDPTKGIGYMTHLDPVAVDSTNEGAGWLLMGVTISQVIHRWNKAGFKTVSGKPWTISLAQKYLSTPKLAGLVSYKGEVLGEGSWPAVLAPATWRAIQPFVRPGGSRPKGANARKWLLSGFLICAICETKLVAGKDKLGAHIYKCPPKTAGGCNGVTRSLAWLERNIRTYVATAIEVEQQALPAAMEGTPDSERLEAEIQELEGRVKDARQAAVNGVMSMIDAGEITTGLREKIRALRAAQAQAFATEKTSMPTEDLLAVWNKDTPDTLGERRTLLGKYVRHVMVHPLGPGRWRTADIPAASATIVPA